MTAKEFFKGWYRCFDEEIFQKTIKGLPSLYSRGIVFPEYKSIFKAFSLCDYNNLKVVIIGMDPYSDGSATGLAFGNNKDKKTLSPSLQVIKDCLCWNDPIRQDTFDQTLESWAKQGVLLLNSSLTVVKARTGSHSLYWREFISSFLKGLSGWQTGIVYVLMGEQAQSFKSCIGPFNDIIECRHPSYYARTHSTMPNVFEQVDKLTWEKNAIKINWYGRK